MAHTSWLAKKRLWFQKDLKSYQTSARVPATSAARWYLVRVRARARARVSAGRTWLGLGLAQVVPG